MYKRLKSARFIGSIVLVLLGVAFNSSAQSLYYPQQGTTWEEKKPRALKMDAKKLQSAVAFAQANEYKGERELRAAIVKGFAHEPYHKLLGPVRRRGGPAGLVIKDGYIVAKWGDLSRVDMTFSVTKSYLSTIAGLAIDAGHIHQVDDPVSQYVWDGTFDGGHNSKITWANLLTQTSDWSGELFGQKDWADRPPKKGGIDDWKNRPLLTPGTQFEYNDVRVNVLAYALLQVWRQPLPVVLKERIMQPIGASTTWRWYGYDNSWVNIDGQQIQSVSGGGHSGGGMFINTYDQARFGLLFARNGQWAGQQVLSANWIAKAVKPSQPNNRYGFMWWLNQEAWPGVTKPLFYAAGFGGNFIIVSQADDLVIVTRWLEPSKVGEMAKKVLEALNP